MGDLYYGDLYYRTDDGTYHKLSQIAELQETIMAEDEKIFESKEDPATIRNLSRDGYFEQELIFSAGSEEIKKIFEDIDRLFKHHIALMELYWIAEYAKRYIVEHRGKETT